MRTVKEFRLATEMSLPQAMGFLDRARVFMLRYYPHLFESTNIDDWELPARNETPEQWATRNITGPRAKLGILRK